MNRRAFVAGPLALLAVPLAAEAQPAARLPRVGLLLRAAPGSSPNLEAFRQGFIQ
jgi:hypothetical protein